MFFRSDLECSKPKFSCNKSVLITSHKIFLGLHLDFAQLTPNSNLSKLPNKLHFLTVTWMTF